MFILFFNSNRDYLEYNITAVSLKDEGTYFCVASNAIGEGSANAILNGKKVFFLMQKIKSH